MRLLFENFGWKLLSLTLAVLLWFAILGEPRLSTFISAPLEFRNTPEDLEISSELPASVRLEVHGPATQVGQPSPSTIAVVLNLAKVYRPGEYTFTVDESNVSVPPGVRLSRAVPSQIRLRFEQRLNRDVPVQARFAGPPPEGYRVGRIEIQPEHLSVVGPEGRINHIAYVETDPIDLEGVVGEREFHVPVFVGDPMVRFESSSLVTIKVFMERIP